MSLFKYEDPVIECDYCGKEAVVQQSGIFLCGCCSGVYNGS